MSSPFRSDCLKGKIALVTGGGSGICFEITKQLLLHGCDGAVICGRRETFLIKSSALLERTTNKPCLYKVCDVRDAQACVDAVQYCMRNFHKLDILVNGAAGNFLAEAKSLTPKGFKTVMEIDTLGTYHMSHAAHSALCAAAGGSSSSNNSVIINISATLHYGATWYQCHASAAKSAVDSLTRSWALEWGSDNIRVVGIAPGPIADTPGTTKLAPPGIIDKSDIQELVNEGIPLSRMGQTWDIGMAAVYLCSDGASYVTGHTLVVDGGQWLYRPPMIPKEMVAELSRKVEAKSRAQAPKSKL